MNDTPLPRQDIEWRRVISIAVPVLVAVGLASLVAAVIGRQPWLALVGVPSLVLLVLDFMVLPPPEMEVGCTVDRARVNEGRPVVVTVTITAAADGVVRLDVVGDGGAHIEGSRSVEFLVRAGVPVERTIEMTCRRWGAASVRVERLSWRSPVGLLSWSAEMTIRRRVWVHPVLAPTRSRLGVRSTGVRPGVHRSTTRGSGVEYHSSRPFEAGDRWRDVDQRLSARRDEPWVVTRHAERSRDLIIVVDLVLDHVHGGEPVADHAVRLADGMARDHLDDRDRVGMVVVGQRILSVRAADGSRQRDRLLGTLLRSAPREVIAGWRLDLTRWVPRRTTVVVITPLVDQSTVATLIDLRRRDCDVSVVRIGADLIQRHRDASDALERSGATMRLIEDHHAIALCRSAGIVVSDVGIDDDPAVALERHQVRHAMSLRR